MSKKKEKQQEEFAFEADTAEHAEEEADDNGEKDTSPSFLDSAGPLKTLIDRNFLEFASYVICERAIPNLADGLKPVQRRILHALSEMDDGRFIKVANVVGHTMQYHPHGDAAIGAALISLTNRGFLIEGQGNFGNIFTGDEAAAPRYIECRLTELARREVVNKDLTDFTPSYDGRNREPVTLPCKLPLLLMLGAEGIAVGLSTRILPHNFRELLEAQIAILQKKPFKVFPDFPQGGLMDITGLENGNGSLRLRARIHKAASGKLKIHELPYGATTDSLIASIEDAARRKKVPVKSITDFTSGKVEIELTLQADADPDKAIQALYAFTGCESTVSSRIVLIHDRRPVEMTVDEVLRENTRQLVCILKRELSLRRKKLLEDIHQKTLVEIFVENRIYKPIEECKTYAAVQKAVLKGFEPFRDKLRRDITNKDVEMLLGIQIRRISRFDLEKNRKNIEAMLKELAQVEKDLKHLSAYAVRYLKALLKKYADPCPRRTEITTFKEVEVRKLTARELDIKHDKKAGFLGHAVSGDSVLSCSSYDKLFLMWKDGTYKVIQPPDKFFVDKHLVYCAKADRNRVMTMVYTYEDLTYIKRFKVGGTILDKEYLATPKGAKVLLLEEGTPDTVYVKYKPAKRQRIHQQTFQPADIPVKTAKAMGNHMTAKAVARIAVKRPRWWDPNEASPNGVVV